MRYYLIAFFGLGILSNVIKMVREDNVNDRLLHLAAVVIASIAAYGVYGLAVQ